MPQKPKTTQNDLLVVLVVTIGCFISSNPNNQNKLNVNVNVNVNLNFNENNFIVVF